MMWLCIMMNIRCQCDLEEHSGKILQWLHSAFKGCKITLSLFFLGLCTLMLNNKVGNEIMNLLTE